MEICLFQMKVGKERLRYCYYLIKNKLRNLPEIPLLELVAEGSLGTPPLAICWRKQGLSRESLLPLGVQAEKALAFDEPQEAMWAVVSNS